jgi:hypothetical protein
VPTEWRPPNTGGELTQGMPPGLPVAAAARGTYAHVQLLKK